MKFNKETIINILFIIIIGIVTLSIAIDVQQKAVEECLKMYENCSTTILSY